MIFKLTFYLSLVNNRFANISINYFHRQHISRDTAEMLNQLHIKSNGCFLYLEKVLDGVAENFIVLREVPEI